jgi:hypothetical protein
LHLVKAQTDATTAEEEAMCPGLHRWLDEHYPVAPGLV